MKKKRQKEKGIQFFECLNHLSIYVPNMPRSN